MVRCPASDPGLTDTAPPAPRLGLAANWRQFSLLVLVNAFVGAMVGLERSILPQLAEQEFQLLAHTAILSFIVVFGITKALTNYFAGRFSERFGRKPVLVAGWAVAVPVPFLLMWAPTWGFVLLANALLGVSQGLTWSTTVIMKIDLAGPERRGLAMGLNEFAGYLAVALAALATGLIAARYGLRPHPFILGVVFVAAGLALSIGLVRETRGHAQHEAETRPNRETLPPGAVFARTSFVDRDLSAVSQAGLVNNLNDGMSWGLFPLFFAAAGMSLREIGWLAAVYPAVWGVGQLVTGPALRPPGPQVADRFRPLGPGRWESPWWPCPRASRASAWERSCSALEPRWSIPRCSRRSATSRTRAGARPLSASIGSGATSATLPARSWPASPPTDSASRPPSSRWQP